MSPTVIAAIIGGLASVIAAVAGNMIVKKVRGIEETVKEHDAVLHRSLEDAYDELRDLERRTHKDG